MRLCLLAGVAVLGGCATGMAPITEHILSQSFTITNPAKSAICHGTFQRAPDQTEVVAPIQCIDGRSGTVAIRTEPNGHPTVATASLIDGTTAYATFLPILGDRHAYAEAPNLLPPSAAYIAASQSRSTAPATSSSPSRSYRPATYRKYIRGPRGGCYYLTASGNKEYVDRGLCH